MTTTLLPRGTLVTWSSWGNNYTGFIVGTCAYDNAGPDNAYVCRYVWEIGDSAPRHPFGIVAVDEVELMKEWPEDFAIGSHWSATPKDRCDEWKISRGEDGSIRIVPNEE